MERTRRVIGRIASIYETFLWYPWFIAVFAGRGATSLARLASDFSESLEFNRGLVLDVACGPATYTRRIASDRIHAIGIDLSMRMLRRGIVHMQRDRCIHAFLAQADALHLPFQPSQFDAVICGGALHLFTDTFQAFVEIGRVLKPGAHLSVSTLIRGERGLLNYRIFREFIKRYYGFTAYELDDLMLTLRRAGFTSVENKLYGSLLYFRARKVPLSE